METKRIDISSWIYVLLMVVTFLISTSLKGQDFLKHDMALVEFNTSWNIDNSFKELSEVKNCCIYNVNLCDNIEYMKLFNIYIPSIIIYINGDEIKRYQANLMMEFECNLKSIQRDIDSLWITNLN